MSLNVIREFVGHSEDSREIEKIYLHVMQKGKHKIEQAMIDLAKIIKWVIVVVVDSHSKNDMIVI